LPSPIPRPHAFPIYSRPERVADLAIHLLGLGFALIGVPILLAFTLPRMTVATGISVPLYALGLLSMLTCSTLYHFSNGGRAKEILRRFDQAAIFLMIAGTYGPVTLVMLGGAWGISLFSAAWSIALIGVILAFAFPRRVDRILLVLYLILGWSILVGIKPLVGAVTGPVLMLLTAGGGLYTLGVVFHLAEKLPFQNAIWHVFVLAAAGCHYAAIFDGVVLRQI
jgi:hemolysin III